MASEDTQREAMEMLNQFDILYNNIASNQAPGLNPYEISLLLTKAQKEVVKNHFTAKGNRYQEGYDDSSKRHSDFASLLCTKTLDEASIATGDRIDYRSLTYKMPEDVMLILNEQLLEYEKTAVEDTGTGSITSGISTGLIPRLPTAIENSSSKDFTGAYTVVAIDQDEYARLMQKPYKYPPKNQFWKLDNGRMNEDSHETFVEIIGKQKEKHGYLYKVRYIRNPEPIVLMDLGEIGDGLSIEGVSTINPCKLPKQLQDEIVQRAVELAKAAWQGDLNSAIELGQRSE